MSTTATHIQTAADMRRVERVRRARRQRRRRRDDVLLAAFLLIAGLAVMLYPKYTDLRYEFSQWSLARAVASAPLTSTESADPSAAGIILPEGAVARLTIPAIELDAFVVEGTSTSALAKGPGHYPGTPLPGESGNVAIAGHRTMHGHVFHDLHELEPGDEIHTGTSTTIAVYRVVEVTVVRPRDTYVADATFDDRLTLTTCNPIGSAAQRLVVVAERED